MEFQKYIHLERLGTQEVDGITQGTVYVFPKLDGTNASVWLNDDGTVGAGSRNRVLTAEADNAGFHAFVKSNENLKALLTELPEITVYGEWLVPHSLKTYRDDAWRRFYIFDVMQDGLFVPYDYYKTALHKYELDYLSPLRIIKNGSDEDFRRCVEENKYLIQEGKGIGEGVVLKNYGWANRHGRTTWAKIIANSFKEEHHKVMGAPITGGEALEEKIIEKFVTEHLIRKVYDKITVEAGGWHSRFIPQLLNTVFYDLIREEGYEIVKHFKFPKIDYKFLQRLANEKIKATLSEVF